MARWPRREVYGFFSGLSNPFFMVTFRVDVTEAYDYAKAHGLSFYTAMVGLCTQAVNDVEAFRMAIHGGDVVLLDRRHPSYTDMKKGAEVFHIVTMRMEEHETVEAFARRASAVSAAQDGFIDMSLETDDLIYISCLPWLDVTAVTNERDLSAPGARDDSIPRLVWGRFVERDGRRMLGMSMEVNHRLIDGVHIGRFAQALETRMKALR